jgi:hypothetical protein
MRDTFSCHFPESRAIGGSSVTDITADNRFFYMGSEPTSVSYIHRIDMAPASTAPAPDVISISFGQPQLLLASTTPIPITVQVSDPKGADNIQSVQIHTLVDGREFHYGQVYEPLSYTTSLTNNGGGVFTGTVVPNKYSSFYTTYALPRPVGVRVVVRNKDEHYVLADTVIPVLPASISQPDCLFNWAERAYSNLFAPPGAVSGTSAPYYYRYYPTTNSYLGTSSVDSHVYYMGPMSNHSILDVGTLSGWLATAGCQ